jgi:hypothetical protein
MRAELAAQGAVLDDVFYCPRAKGACDCRKPFIGDGECDRLLAERCGIPFALVRGGRVVGTSVPP